MNIITFLFILSNYTGIKVNHTIQEKENDFSIQQVGCHKHIIQKYQVNQNLVKNHIYA